MVKGSVGSVGTVRTFPDLPPNGSVNFNLSVFKHIFTHFRVLTTQSCLFLWFGIFTYIYVFEQCEMCLKVVFLCSPKSEVHHFELCYIAEF